MSIHKFSIKLDSCGNKPTYHNITKQVREMVSQSGIKNGICVVQSPHTTCSVIFEEYVHDVDYNGYDFLQIDLNRILDRIIPRETTENMDYKYPGPLHTECLKQYNGPEATQDKGVILNADAHLRGTLFGPSETFIVENEELLTGSFGSIYFVDWDQIRVRHRTCHVMIIGE